MATATQRVFQTGELLKAILLDLHDHRDTEDIAGAKTLLLSEVNHIFRNTIRGSRKLQIDLCLKPNPSTYWNEREFRGKHLQVNMQYTSTHPTIASILPYRLKSKLSRSPNELPLLLQAGKIKLKTMGCKEVAMINLVLQRDQVTGSYWNGSWRQMYIFPAGCIVKEIGVQIPPKRGGKWQFVRMLYGERDSTLGEIVDYAMEICRAQGHC